MRRGGSALAHLYIDGNMLLGGLDDGTVGSTVDGNGVTGRARTPSLATRWNLRGWDGGRSRRRRDEFRPQTPAAM